MTRRINGLLEITAIKYDPDIVIDNRIQVKAFISHIGPFDLSSEDYSSEAIKQMLDHENNTSSASSSSAVYYELQYKQFTGRSA